MNEKDYEIWLKYAKENAAVARLTADQLIYNAALQNTQQSIEKYLKALLISKGQPIVKTHAISALIQLLENLNCHLDVSEADIEFIDLIYLPSKYPIQSVFPNYNPTEQHVRRALNILERIENSLNNMTCF